MKTKLFLTTLLSFSFYLLSSQVPQGFNYQAIARGSDGKEIANTTLLIKVSILSDTTGFYAGGAGIYVWEEQQSVKTNSMGLFTLTVGNPLATKIQGSAGTFSAVDWKQQPLYIGTKINYSGWKNMGTSRLWTVPYAMVAGDLKNNSRVQVSGDANSSDSILFEVKNRTGQTVFAVYEEGVRIYVDDGTYKGKGKGGFAIGSFGAAKAPSQEYFRVTRDSTRIYTNPAAKGTKGGFAIGTFAPAKGLLNNYLNLTPNNYLIGQDAGKSITTGLYNNFIGYQAGSSNTTGANNSFIGYQAGIANVSGSTNTFVGNQAGAGNQSGSANTFIGTQSGKGFISGGNNTYLGVGAGVTFQNGNYNVFIGSLAGAGYQFPTGATGGSNNVAVGTGAGYKLNTGSNNVLLGNFAGLSNTAGSNNVFLGYQSGYLNSTGNYNLFLGNQSGYTNSTGYNNTFLGYQTGLSNTIGYNNVFLGNNSGNANTEGYYNTFIGNNAGYANSTGIMNIFIGNEAGVSNTTASRNVFIGPYAGRYNSTGEFNVFLGQQTGEANTTGSFNLFAGRSAGNFNTTGILNTFLGVNAGNSNTEGRENVALGGESAKLNGLGSYNVSLGTGAGYSNTNGNTNIMIGYYSGVSLTSGNNNIFIGPYSGGGLTTTSSKLFIENSGADLNNALIYGDFSADYLKFNANVDIRNSLSFPNNGAVLWVGGKEALWFNGTYYSWGFGGTYNYFGSPVAIGTTANPGTYKLYVAGNVAVTGTVTNPSDARYKTNISEFGSVLDKLGKIRSVSYDWNSEKFPEMKLDSSRQIGFIAQEVEPLFPELVKTNTDGYKSLDYSKMTVVLLQAVKEQQKQIELSSKENQQLRSDINLLREEVEKLKVLASEKGLK
jgi:hypothetical protein